MSGTDRAEVSPDPILDVLRRENAAVGADDWTVLAEARARQGRALAYRATVFAVYAEAGLHAAARSGDSRAAGV